MTWLVTLAKAAVCVITTVITMWILGRQPTASDKDTEDTSDVIEEEYKKLIRKG